MNDDRIEGLLAAADKRQLAVMLLEARAAEREHLRLLQRIAGSSAHGAEMTRWAREYLEGRKSG